MGGQHLHRVLGLVGFGILVSNMNIQNTISTMGPETMDMKICAAGKRQKEQEMPGTVSVEIEQQK